MKRILFVDTGLEFGGGSKSLIYLLKEIVKLNRYEILVYFEHDYDLGDRKISQIISQLGVKFVQFEQKREISKLKREILRIFSKISLQKAVYKNDFEFALRLLESVKPDILHLNNHFSTNLAYNQAANLLKINVIQHLRKNSLVERFKLEILKKLKFLPICISNSTFDFYSKQINMPKFVVYNPVVCTEISKQKSENKDISIVMPANFLTLKGHDLVFDAFLQLDRSDVKLYLAGSGDFAPSTKYKLERLEKLNIVKNLGFVKNMDEIYKKCDYVLGFSSDEGLSRIVIEGLSYGLGVIFSDINVMREIYSLAQNKEYFFIVKRDSAELLKCLQNLKKPHLQNPDTNIINTFSLQNYASKIVKIYEDLL